MRNFLGDELDEVGDELVKTWIGTHAFESGFPEVDDFGVVIAVEDGCADFVEEKD